MARFPIDESTFLSLGKALARAVDDTVARQSFVADPRAYLIEAGIDEAALDGLSLVVSEDTEKQLHFVIPTTVHASRSKTDPDYLEELGQSITLGCAYMTEKRIVDLPQTTDERCRTGTDG